MGLLTTKTEINSPAQTPYRQIFSILPENIRDLLSRLPLRLLDRLEEIRLRQNRPLIVTHTAGDLYMDPAGQPASNPTGAYIITADDMQRAIRLVSNSSLYAIEEELKNGYVTLPGGHRVGITGKAVVESGKVKTLKYISGFNIRISREIKGTAMPVVPGLLDRAGRIKHTLILSPPRCGKTTLLRDLVRLVSSGVQELQYNGATVGLVDERSELAGCYRGVPQRDIGLRTDVLDGCPKAEGMMMLLRSMSPQVIATDEIGKQEDIKAMEEVINAGVTIISTVHGSSLQEIMRRPALKYLLSLNVIERFIILSRSKGVGTVEDIIHGNGWQARGVGK